MSWRTPEDMLALLAEVKGRRRFQGFGTCFQQARAEQLLTVDKGAPADPPVNNCFKASGGAAKGRHEKLYCPHGEPLRFVRITTNEEEANAWCDGRGR